jgi:hypothetical protein
MATFLERLMHRRLLMNISAVLIASTMLQFADLLSAEPPDFENDIAPLLIRRCVECHQSANPSGGLSLQSAEDLAKGGDSGPVVVAKSVKESRLIERVVAGEMPPVKHGESQKLPESEIEILRRWVEEGAHFPADRQLDLYEQTTDVRGGRDWWSFQPLKEVAPPVVEGLPNDGHPIDRFIAVELQKQELTAAPKADARTLMQRLYWDVTGLPPSANEIQSFTTAPQNEETTTMLIDQLLASPHFGERWARHWLDVVRFAETCGYERDQVKPFAWKYRDWVVNAFNSDMPYDLFVREQLAGDEIPDRTEQSVIATGFLCLGTWNDEPNDAEDYKYERLEDLVHTTSSAFLGMTTKCARCHDHKFDPIPQTDYYRMAAAFWPGPIQPRGRELLGGVSADELGYKEVLGWTDVSKSPAPLHKLKNGERNQPLEPVSAGSLTFVPDQFREFALASESVRTAGLRLQLAEWIASEKNPLTARVIVNRIWQHHFGEGLVRSSNNFGYTGDKPTHPELLDWLASELIRNRWSLKHVHRLILTSQTWQQASLHPRQDDYSQKDSANRYLWRANRRRKDAESLRDAFLVATHELQLSLGGPSFYPTISADALEGLSRKTSAWTASPEADQYRRSLYIFTQRSLLPPMMTTFDMCESTMSCGQRDVTIVAPQALTLMNNEFVHKRAAAIAISCVKNEEPISESNVRQVWEKILGRVPTDQEQKLAMAHIENQLRRFREPPTVSVAAEQSANQQSLEKLLQTTTLYLNAEAGLETDDHGHLRRWLDQSNAQHHASQEVVEYQPLLVKSEINGHPAIRFDGTSDFLHVAGKLIDGDESTVFAVVTDHSADSHREIISNWSGRDGNSGTSYFVGMTNKNAIRLSDALSGVGEILDRQNPFLITATNGEHGAAVYQQKRIVIEQPSAIPARRLDTPWVIGQQGNINGEYWKGDIACVLVFNEQLSPKNRTLIQDYLIERYQLPSLSEPVAPSMTPEQLAIASLSVVLFNSNEFAYVD